jgi:hypothetical protein
LARARPAKPDATPDNAGDNGNIAAIITNGTTNLTKNDVKQDEPDGAEPSIYDAKPTIEDVRRPINPDIDEADDDLPPRRPCMRTAMFPTRAGRLRPTIQSSGRRARSSTRHSLR